MKLKTRLNSNGFTRPVISTEAHTKDQSRTQDKRILKVQELLGDDVGHSWTAQELGLEVSLSPSHLRQLFKNETGKTVGQFLKELRMHAAKTLLRSEFLTVKEVMNRVGIANRSHFAKDFKRAHGVSPSRINKHKSPT